MNIASYFYDLHNLCICTQSNDRAVKKMLTRTLQYKGASSTPLQNEPDITLDFCTDRTLQRPEQAHRLGVTEEMAIEVWRTAEGMVLSRGSCIVRLTPNAGRAEAGLPPTLNLECPRTSKTLFYLITLSLVILLRHRGWYPLHTAAVARDGRGVLLVAQSDSGKSTATFNLVRRGWNYLSDDTVLLRLADEHARAYSFRRNFCVDPEAARHFPELRDQAWSSSLSDAQKWQVDVDRLYPGQFVATCDPALIVLPTIAETAESRIEPVPTKAVFTELITQGSFFLTPDREVATRHVTVLQALLRQSRTYRLHAGRDARDDPSVLHNLLAPLVCG